MKRAPRVAAVHDMSGVGRCSLTVILPVLAAMGCQCNPMLTAYLSAHTAFPASEHAVFLDLTDQMGQVAAHWGELGVEPDAVYSGFLGSERQIGLLQTAICRFRREKTLVLVDPVMGDHGRAYRTCTPELCARMGELAAVCGAAGWLLKNGGRFALVCRPERLGALFAALRGAGLEPKRLRLAQHGPDTPPFAALVEAVRQGREGLAVLPTLVEHP